MTGLCNVLLSKPSKSRWPSRSLSARPWSQTAPAPSRALGGSRASCAQFMWPAPGVQRGMALGELVAEGMDTGTPLTTITDVRVGALLPSEAEVGHSCWGSPPILGWPPQAGPAFLVAQLPQRDKPSLSLQDCRHASLPQTSPAAAVRPAGCESTGQPR